jgi:serine/threonine-protein kinase
MAEVWLARQEGPAGFAKEVVVKTILPQLAEDHSFIQMFLDEARLAARLNHPNVVQIYELGEEAGTYFLVMEYIRGRNLRAVQRRLRDRKEPFPPGILAHVLVGTCEGLHYAHEATDELGRPMHLVHRDISPDNVLLSVDGQAKVVDFGIAKAASATGTTRPGTLKGKFGYMSPEQALGRDLDRRADVYSLGVVLYELLAGTRPFHSNSELGLLNAIVHTTPPPIESLRPDLPEGLAKVVMRTLAKDREQRFSSAREVGLALDSWMRQCAPTNVVDVAAFLERLFGAERTFSPVIPPRVPSRPGPASVGGRPAAPVAAPSPSSAPAALEAGPGPSPERAAAAPAPAPAIPPPRPRSRWRLVVSLAAMAGMAALGVGAWGGLRPAELAPVPPPPLAASPDAAAVLPDAATKALEAKPPEIAAPMPDAGDPPDAAAPAADRIHRPSVAPVVARQPKGRIVFRVNPWAEVTVDGRKLGVTPLPPAEVAPGMHRVLLENGDLGVKRALSVEVRAGKDAPVRFNFLE